MGLFYTNLTVHGAERSALRAALVKLQRTAYISPTENGQTVVYDRAIDEEGSRTIEQFGRKVTRTLGCVALAASLHDDDVLYLWLFRKGRVIDRYDSCPGYYDARSRYQSPAGGDSRMLGKAFDCPENQERVEFLLRTDILEEKLPELPGELERHQALAAALGLPWYVAGLGYSALAGGYVEEKFRGVAFEAVPEV